MTISTVSQSTCTVVQAIAASYASRGYRTFGLTWTPAAALDLQGGAQLDDSFAAGAWVRAVQEKQVPLDSRTLLLLLDQGQLRLRDKADVLALAKAAGAKVVLVGAFPDKGKKATLARRFEQRGYTTVTGLASTWSAALNLKGDANGPAGLS